MFGTYRLLLALLVLLKHFKETEVFSGIAVWAFFLLSGFLITGVLNTRYPPGRTGFIEFSINRALRVFPTYWLSIVLALISILVFQHTTDPRLINSAFDVPDSGLEWISTFLIFGGTFFGIGRLDNSLSPSSWAVDVEMLMYVASILWLSRTWKGAKLTFLVCAGAFPFLYLSSKFLAWNGYSALAGSLIYSSLPAALIPYALGACLWHIRGKLNAPQRPYTCLLPAIFGFLLCGLLLSHWSVTASFLAALPIMAYTTWLLSVTKVTSEGRRIDTFFGHMSYPVYLLHWVGNYNVLATAELLGNGRDIVVPDGQGLLQTTLMGFTVIVVVTLLMSAVIACCFEAPIDARRHKWSSRLTALLLGRRSSRPPEKNG
ncbi:acyltransferase family protein [Rhizobium etli]|uniref:acyltransferase family protein n=1 Tax=Rhizobium etli TaxID=29449 RepID=UPI000383A26F|nr:acyltransferase [Rhizobium etli]AGS20634.1 acyltransferase 3 protein [Rhizobium etli bv. mimosae str. Mim1]